MKKKRVLIIVRSIIVLIIAAAAVLAYLVVTDKSIFTEVDKILSVQLGDYVRTAYEGNGTLYWPAASGALATVDHSQQLRITTACTMIPSKADAQVNRKLSLALKEMDAYFLSINYKKVNFPPFSTDQAATKDDGANINSIVGFQNNTAGRRCVRAMVNVCSLDSKGRYYREGTLTCNDISTINKAVAHQDSLLALAHPGETMIVLRSYGSFYVFSVGSPIGAGGYALIAEKTNGGWMKIGETQSSLHCNIVNQYHIPHQIWGSCWDTVTNKDIPNSN